MKTRILGLVAVLAFVVSCADEKSGSSSYVPPTSPYVPIEEGPGYKAGGIWGASAKLKVNSIKRMSDYTGRAMYDPHNIRINLNLVRYGKSYGGTALISYNDAGIEYEGYFTSGHSAEETKYNIWFEYQGNQVWHGFFEDYMGALIVVIDGVTDLGDGVDKNAKASGSVWYKNYGYTDAPHPPQWCWFVSIGPYDCRAWKDGQKVDTTKKATPDANYIELGTFENMNLKKAFNGELKL